MLSCSVCYCNLYPVFVETYYVFFYLESDDDEEFKPKEKGRGKAAKADGPAKPKKAPAAKATGSKPGPKPKADGAKAGPKATKPAAKPKPKASSPKKKRKDDSDSEDDMFASKNSSKKGITSDEDFMDDSFEIQPRAGRAKKPVKYQLSSDEDSSSQAFLSYTTNVHFNMFFF